MTSTDEKCITDLGFAEECEPWLLTNTFFPSKIGGRPAWLDLDALPMPGEIKCLKCGEPLVFLCQVLFLAIAKNVLKRLFIHRFMHRWKLEMTAFIELSTFSFVGVVLAGN